MQRHSLPAILGTARLGVLWPQKVAKDQPPPAQAMKVVQLVAECRGFGRPGQRGERKEKSASGFRNSRSRLAPYTAESEYQCSVGPAAIHDEGMDFFYGIEGRPHGAGGKLVGESRDQRRNLTEGHEGGSFAKASPKEIHCGFRKTLPTGSAGINGSITLMSLHVHGTTSK